MLIDFFVVPLQKIGGDSVNQSEQAHCYTLVFHYLCRVDKKTVNKNLKR